MVAAKLPASWGLEAQICLDFSGLEAYVSIAYVEPQKDLSKEGSTVLVVKERPRKDLSKEGTTVLMVKEEETEKADLDLLEAMGLTCRAFLYKKIKLTYTPQLT